MFASVSSRLVGQMARPVPRPRRTLLIAVTVVALWVSEVIVAKPLYCWPAIIPMTGPAPPAA